MESPRSRREADQGGFTLIELMVVVLIIAILLAIAIPTFLGARTRASDRAAQSNLRNAHLTELIVFAGDQQFTADTAALTKVDPSLTYTNDPADLSPQGSVVYVLMLPTPDTVLVGAKSGSGSCFWIRATGGTHLLRFADNDCNTIPPDPGTYRDKW